MNSDFTSKKANIDSRILTGTYKYDYIENSDSDSSAILLDNDGKFILVGTSDNSEEGNYAGIPRFRYVSAWKIESNTAVDRSFGNSGIYSVLYPFKESSFFSYPYNSVSEIIKVNDDYIVCGKSGLTPLIDYSVTACAAQYTGIYLPYYKLGVNVDVLYAGDRGSYLIKMDSSGKLVTDFGTEGIAQIVTSADHINQKADNIYAMITGVDGSVYATGYYEEYDDDDDENARKAFFVAQIDSTTGDLISIFRHQHDDDTSGRSRGLSIVQGSDGSFYVAGSIVTSAVVGKSQAAVWKITGDLSDLDGAFGTGGTLLLTTDTGGNSKANAICIDSSGEFLYITGTKYISGGDVNGYGYNIDTDMTVWKVNITGQTTEEYVFTSNLGSTDCSMDTTDEGAAITLSNNKILIAGNIMFTGNSISEFYSLATVWRLNSDMTIDNTFFNVNDISGYINLTTNPGNITPSKASDMQFDSENNLWISGTTQGENLVSEGTSKNAALWKIGCNLQ